MTDQKVHKCPECGAECRCERGNFNPKDCVHYECFTGIAEPEVTNPVLEQKELLLQLTSAEMRDYIIRAHGLATGKYVQDDTEMRRRIGTLLGKAIQDDAVMTGVLGRGGPCADRDILAGNTSLDDAPTQPAEDEREARQDAVRLIDQLEGIEDLLSRGPWEASQPDPFPYKVTIGNYTFDCPIGSSQIRADESNIPSGCLIPSGIIHHDDAEGIAELRNMVPHLIKTLRSLLPTQDSTYEALRTISLGKHYPSCPIAQKTGKGYDDCDCMIGVAYKAITNVAQPAASTPTEEPCCEHGVLQSMECLSCTEEYVAASTEAQDEKLDAVLRNHFQSEAERIKAPEGLVDKVMSKLAEQCQCTDHDPEVCLNGEVDEGSRYCHCKCHQPTTPPDFSEQTERVSINVETDDQGEIRFLPTTITKLDVILRTWIPSRLQERVRSLINQFAAEAATQGQAEKDADIDALKYALREAAIFAHVGWSHPTNWTDCEYPVCVDRKKLIGDYDG